MKKKPRKPRVLNAGLVYPRIEAEEGRIWMQNVPHGKWIKVPLGRARYILDRLQRAIRHIKYG